MNAGRNMLFSLLVFCLLVPPALLAADDTIFVSSCPERKQFTWEEIQKLAQADWLKKTVASDEFQSGKPPPFDDSTKAYIWSLITTPELGPAGGGVTLINLSGAGLSGLDTCLTHLGGILAVVQLYNDYKDNNPAMQVNFAKSASFWSIGTFSVFSTALKTAAVGVGLFDYTLNKLGSATSSMRYEFWEKAYAKYYDKKYGYRVTTKWDAGLGRNVIDQDDTEKWIDLIFRQHGGDVDKALKEGFSDFWKDPEGCALEVGMNPYGKFVQNILKDDQESIRQNYLRHVLPSVRTAFAWKKDRAQRDLVIEFQIAADKIYDELHKELVFFGWVTDKDGWPLEGAEVQLFTEDPVITRASGKYEIRIKACKLYDSFQIRGQRQAELTARMDDPLSDTDYAELKRVDIAYVAGTPLKEQGPHNIVIATREIREIRISPSDITIKEGLSASVTVLAVLSDGSESDITDRITWFAAEESIARADAAQITAGKPGTTEITAEYQGKKSGPCRVTVIPAKELLKLETGPSPLNLKPGQSAQLQAWATFSDGQREDVSQDPACRWQAAGTTVSLSRNEVTALKAAPGQAAPLITATYTFGGKSLSASTQVNIEEEAQILAFKLNKTEVVMGLNENVGLRASAIIGKGPLTTPADMTDKVSWSASDRQIIVQTAQGVIVSGSAEGACDVTATLKQKDGSVLTAVCRVTVMDKSAPLPEVDFTISPPKFSHQIGEKITFTQNISTKDLKAYDFIWFIGNEEQNGLSASRIFDKSGNYTVRLVLRSRKTGKEDALSKTVRIEALPDADCSISVPPGPYSAPVTITFSALCTDPAAAISSLRWYIDGQLVQEGESRTFAHTFQESGKYLVKLGMRTGSNFDEGVRTLVIAVGEPEPAAQTSARQVNRFETEVSNEDLSVAGSCWIGGDGKWSDWLVFDRVGPVLKHVFCTGDAEGGYNTGYLVYAPGPGKLLFRVYGYNFQQRRGRMVYDGSLDIHGKQVDAASLRIADCQPRAAVIEWRCTDGSLCKARIFKTPESGYVTGGAQDMGCIEGRPGTQARGTLKQALESAARQKQINPGEVLGPQTEGLKEMSKELDFGTPECMYTIRGNLPNANGGTVEVYVFDDSRAAENGILKWKKYFTSLGDRYETDVTPVSFHNLQAFTWMLYYSEKTEKDAKKMAQSSKESRETFKDWIGYRHYGMAWIHDNTWVSLYTKQNTAAGKSDARNLAETVYSEMAAVAAGRFYCEGDEVAIREFTYLNSIWPARLQKGRLEVRGAGGSSGKWRESEWITVASGVTEFDGDGTSKGPVVIYRTGKKWHIVMIEQDSGKISNHRSFDEPVEIIRTGQYGAVIQSGDQCYDYSWNKLQKINCKTGLYE